jgi:hypothetical protein
MNRNWMITVVMILASAVIGAQPSPSAPPALYALRIHVSVDGVTTSVAQIVSAPGVSAHVSALLGTDVAKSPRFQIDAVANQTQQISGGPSVTIKLTLSKPDANGEMQPFAAPEVTTPEGQISYVQIDNITLSMWVTRESKPTIQFQ